MGSINVKIKIMPSSPDVNLEKLEEEIKKLVEKNKGIGCKFEEEPIAFGLKAVMTYFICAEDQELDTLEKELGETENVNSVQVLDIRRAL